MNEESEIKAERLVKSQDRVRDLGEVFTPAATVQAMLDLLPSSMWLSRPSPTFLEPACGDGNFLVAVLDRKLRAIDVAANDPASLKFHGLQSLSSIYGVDISADNVVGGTPGHGIGARDRMLRTFDEWARAWLGNYRGTSSLAKSARWIVDRNILVANMLPVSADGVPTGRADLPLVEYEWSGTDLSVAVVATSLGAAMDEGIAETTGVMTLFGSPSPVVLWSGKATDLHRAPLCAPQPFAGPARNGALRRAER